MKFFKHLFLLILGVMLAGESTVVLAGTNGYLLNCFCAKSFGRGGTVVAIPDNASVILANPAGLSFLGRRSIGLGVGLLIPRVQFSNELNSNTVADQKYYPMPFSGYFDPMPDSRWSWGFGLNVVGGMGADYELNHDLFRDPMTGDLIPQDYFSEFGYVRAGPAFSYKIKDNLSVGAGAQLYYGMLDFKMPFSIDPVENLNGIADPTTGATFGQLFAGAPPNGFGYDEVTAYARMEDLTGFGVGGNIGVYWKINEKFAVGAAYTTPTTMYLEGDANMDMSFQFNAALGQTIQGIMMQNPTLTQQEAQAQAEAMFAGMGIDFQEGVAASYGKNSADFDVPQKLALGFSYQPTSRLIFGFDAEWIDWSAAFDDLPIKLEDGDNTNINLMINGDVENGTFKYNFPLNWDDSYNFKLGADYMVREGTQARIGFIHGTNPVPDNTVFSIFPAIVENHLTFGVGQVVAGRITVDAAYIFSFNKKQDAVSDNHLVGSEYNNSRDQLREQLFMLSVGIGL